MPVSLFWQILTILVIGLLVRHLFIWHPLDPTPLYKQGFLLFGHRGASRYEPENTLPAFCKALKDGCNALELDIHRTWDGHLVIIHDDTLSRTTHAKGRVADYRTAELQNLNAAAGWVDRHERIPTLKELVDILDDDIVINMEIKNFSFFSEQRTELEVVRFIHENNLRERAIVSSFNPLNIWRIKMTDPSIYTALLWYKPSLFSFRHPIGIHLTHPDIFHPYVDHVSRGVHFWSRIKSIPMHVWVVNDQQQMRAFAADSQVRGVMSDDTELLTATLGPERERAPAA